MVVSSADWLVITAFIGIVLGISWYVSKSSATSTKSYFLGGKSLPWWLLGVSMVATTFSADTPNLVTGFVREGGIAKNWVWWSFLITGMITVFIYARLWRKSNVETDLEFYTIRYGGKKAKFLRVFRALYLGVAFNSLIMGSVILAAIKISTILFGADPLQTVLISFLVISVFTAIGGIKGVILTDFFQFIVATFGAIYAAHVALAHPKVGGLYKLISNEALQEKIKVIPDFSDPSMLITMFLIPIAVQWWSVWYPGAEPGGGGYIAQRMLAAKNEKHAVWATFFFNIAHYALRPWPWIIVALCSLVIFPDLDSIRVAYPHIPDQYLGHDIAYPIMLTLLSPGWLGLAAAALIAAFMSTISTHLNWGASYIVNDWYKLMVNPHASERHLVNVGKLSTILLMIFAGILALTILENATQAFNIMLLSGAGTGGIFLLRWFWYRINATTEIFGMSFAFLLAIIFEFFVSNESIATAYIDGFTMKLLLISLIVTISWVLVALFTKREDSNIIKNFQTRVYKVNSKEATSIFTQLQLKKSISNIFLGTISVYSLLFSIGNFLFFNYLIASVLLLVSITSLLLVVKKLMFW